MKEEIGAKAEAELKKELTMVPKATSSMPGLGSSEGFEVWRETATKLYLPKYFGLCRYSVPPVENLTFDPGVPLGDEVTFACSLREEQKVPIKAFLDAARNPSKMGGILSLPCGFGKTVMALHLIVELGVKTMVIVHKDFLLNQWRERISEFIPSARVGLVKAKTIDVDGSDIVLASVQSLSMKEYDDEALFKGIGFLIVDECHRIGSEVFSRSLIKRTFRYSLGISATVQRKDGMTKAFVHFLGDVLFKGKRREDDVLVVQKRFEDESPVYRREEHIGMSGNPNISRMINNITEHPPRNEAIVDAIKYAIEKQPNRRILILSDRKAQLTTLKESIEALGITAGYYIGGMKPAALAESETKQVMCATFAFAAEGMDVPHLDTLVLASPKSDIEQSVGRILRLKPEHRERKPIVIDFVDTFSLFDRQGSKRRSFYLKFKYRIFDELKDAMEDATTTTTTMTDVYVLHEDEGNGIKMMFLEDFT
jgi:superfamily II DNA or RNA helicase